MEGHNHSTRQELYPLLETNLKLREVMENWSKDTQLNEQIQNQLYLAPQNHTFFFTSSQAIVSTESPVIGIENLIP